jgi:hypothetical protein
MHNPPLRSAQAEILEFHPVQEAFGLSTKFIFKYVTCTPPKPNFLLLQPEWSPIHLQSALTALSLIHFSFNA